MRKLFILSLVLFGLVTFGSFEAKANIPTMSLSELNGLLKKGQPIFAYFDSVPEGLTMKRYRILIKGIADSPMGQAVIFTANYHIVAGMSGSPVYVRGKFLGALATSHNNFEEKVFWGGITPFAEMQREDLEGLSQKGPLVKSFFYQGHLLSPIGLGQQSVPAAVIEELEKEHGPDQLSEFLKKGKLVITTQSEIAKGQSEHPLGPLARQRLLRPGMPIVVDLIEWKDQEGHTNSVSALGTITYVDPKTKRLYAFGHPFLDAKKVHYTFRSATIMGTSISARESFKIAGRKTEVLGIIDFDSSRGVYGHLGLAGLELLPRFDLELKREGKTYQNLQVRMGDSRSFMPVFLGFSLATIGQAYGVPLPDEVSSTEWETHLKMKDYPAIDFHKTFSSQEIRVADGRMIHLSSYGEASVDFVSNTFVPLFFSDYSFVFQEISIRANFLNRKPKQMKLSAFHFPDKIIWGEDPILEVQLVGEDNALALEKKVKVKVDWSKVEMPIYGREVGELSKDPNKVVSGQLAIYSPRQAPGVPKSERERQLDHPNFFLNSDDFLHFFMEHLKTTDQTILGKLFFRAKDDLVTAALALLNETSIVSPEVKADSEQWHSVLGGLREHRLTVYHEDFYSLYLNFPDFPSGYVADPNLRKTFSFEVVK